MYEHLNTRTRGIVEGLSQGGEVQLGGESIGPFSSGEVQVLSVLATNLADVGEKTGGELIERVVELLCEVPEEGEEQHVEEGVVEEPAEETEIGGDYGYRLGLLRAYSFRGLAPAGQEWSHDFAGTSHLLYGPNGCGKSSLLGAISWCLTGRIFRDDQAPHVPESVKTYSNVGARVQTSERPDGLALMNKDGRNTGPSDEYWVEIQLLGKRASGEEKEVWVRRHSDDALSMAPDGEAWVGIASVREAGIEELDAELNLLMPARVAHIKFGKDAELVRIFSQIIGLDDLEVIARLAESMCRNLRTQATKIENGEAADEQARINGYIETLKETSSDAVEALPSYNEVVGDERDLEHVKIFGTAMRERKESQEKHLAADLGIAIPTEDSVEFKDFKEGLVNLPGQVQSAVDELAKTMDELFPNSVGFTCPSEAELTELGKRLEEFEGGARQRVKERLEWALEEERDRRASLMLVAAEHFEEGSNECPVCTQDLSKVPEVKQKLEELKPIAGESHLKKDPESLGLELVNELDGVVSAEMRKADESGLCDRVLSDWSGLKERISKGLLKPIVCRFDKALKEIAEQAGPHAEAEGIPLAEGFLDSFPGAFGTVDTAVADARRYVRFCKSVLDKRDEFREALGKVLAQPASDRMDDSLKAILERGRATNEEIDSLKLVHKTTGELWKSMTKHKGLVHKIGGYRRWADAGEATKGLFRVVRREVVEMVGDLDEKMKVYFSRLYDKEILELDMLTPGHPGNPNVKGEINVYVRAGGERIPIGPFCNAGRIRALILSYVFALLEKSGESLGFMILDDPAVSLDDEHQARLVNRVIGRLLEGGQMVLATHYKRFHKLAERVFVDEEKLEMVPRRQVCDEVSFEPGDILGRTERIVRNSPGSWRDVAGSLRRWIERSLRALSGYCPEQFWKHGDLVGSVDAYGRINDDRVATADREAIIGILSQPFIEDVRRFAHEEDATLPEFEDALKTLKQCKKHVDREIRRFKEIYEEDLLALGMRTQPSVRILSLGDAISAWDFEIVTEAAAAHNGEGIEWDENELCHLQGHQVAILAGDVISPIGLRGQWLLLDNEEKMPGNSDLVVVRADSGEMYVRKFWREKDGGVLLEAANPTSPYAPVRLSEGEHEMRRVVGILYDKVGVNAGSQGKEWVPGRLPERWLNGVKGLRVRGTSMEPIAREGQIVLVRRDGGREVEKADLACVDIAGGGTVIKRCYPADSEWVLCSINSSEVEDPMRVKRQDIRNAYPLVGVIFEV